MHEVRERHGTLRASSSARKKEVRHAMMRQRAGH